MDTTTKTTTPQDASPCVAEVEPVPLHYPAGTILYSKEAFSYYLVMDDTDEQSGLTPLGFLCRTDSDEWDMAAQIEVSQTVLRSGRWFVCNAFEASPGHYQVSAMNDVLVKTLALSDGLDALVELGIGMGTFPERYFLVENVSRSEVTGQYLFEGTLYTRRFFGLWNKRERRTYPMVQSLMNYPIFTWELED